MGLVSSDLLVAMKTGVDVGLPGAPMVLRLAVTGIKGDWPFLIECGRLHRHFRRAPKRGQSNMQSEGVCHLCLAGYDNIPFTDVSEAPRFEETMFSAAVSCICLVERMPFADFCMVVSWCAHLPLMHSGFVTLGDIVTMDIRSACRASISTFHLAARYIS